MNTFLPAYMMFLGALRKGAFYLVAVMAVIALVDWAVRTRRINPFGPIGRFTRGTIDPLMAPVERRIVRAGGMPHTAPWWSLVAVTVGSLLLISLLQFVGQQVGALTLTAGLGVTAIVYLLLHWVFEILQLGLVVRVLSSLVGMSPYSRWIRWSFVITEPILGPLRRIVPPMGMFDITPIVAYLLLRVTESVLLR